ncbi:MAG: hypothetical protein GX455_13595 [Phycisphaerae bacterium]|nr:hypothetical protein [Phycisphaerae bacterium]
MIRRLTYIRWITTMIVFVAGMVMADCPLDHFRIGRNADGIPGTDDDQRLFLDCSQKYRHSDPNHSGDPTWRNGFYPLYYNERYNRYQIGEPGFDLLSDDPSRALDGLPNQDFRIVIRCIAVSPGLTARNTAINILLEKPGDQFIHSSMADPHVHLQYRVPAPEDQSPLADLHWMRFVIFDELGQYQPAPEVTVVFVHDPPAGDLWVDGKIDLADVLELTAVWLRPDAARINDYHERADTNRDGRVDLVDLAATAENWLMN